jgi:hypothetical protein
MVDCPASRGDSVSGRSTGHAGLRSTCPQLSRLRPALSASRQKHTQEKSNRQRMQGRFKRRLAQTLRESILERGKFIFIAGQNAECLVGGVLHTRFLSRA